jgi:hypothetical protein
MLKTVIMRSLSVLLLVGALSSAPAFGQLVGVHEQILFCVPYQRAVDYLKAQGETLQTMAVLSDPSIVIETYQSKDDNWTLIMHRSRPHNVACQIAQGQGIVDAAQVQEMGL